MEKSKFENSTQRSLPFVFTTVTVPINFLPHFKKVLQVFIFEKEKKIIIEGNDGISLEITSEI